MSFFLLEINIIKKRNNKKIMDLFILEIALKKIKEEDEISDTLIVSVRNEVLDIFCHEQFNCSEADYDIFKKDLISLNQESRKEYIINLSNFLLEKKNLEIPGYLNYFYDKFKTTLSMIYENKGTVAIGIAAIILSQSIIEQNKKIIDLNEKFVREGRNEEEIIKEFTNFEENENKKYNDETNYIFKNVEKFEESQNNLIDYIKENFENKRNGRYYFSFPKFYYWE